VLSFCFFFWFLNEAAQSQPSVGAQGWGMDAAWEETLGSTAPNKAPSFALSLVGKKKTTRRTKPGYKAAELERI